MNKVIKYQYKGCKMEKNERKLAIAKQAILNEVEGYQFYKMYAEKVSSPEVKKTFMDIANEELQHIEFLKKYMNNSVEDNLKMAKTEIPAPGIFKFSNLTPDDLSLALAAFSIAMKMEDDSQKFYEGEANKAEDEGEKAFLLMLRDWEIKHRDSFEAEYEKLKESWWGDNSFAPF